MKPEIPPLIFASLMTLFCGVSDLRRGQCGTGGFYMWVSGWVLACAWWFA